MGSNLKSVEGFNKWCGPAVLSILTGKSTDDCAYVISQITGNYEVRGVLLHHLLRAADKLGFDQKEIVSDGSLFRVLTSLVETDGMYLVTVPNHFVCVEVKNKEIYFCDNHTKDPIRAAGSARLMQQVVKVHQMVERPKPEPPKVPQVVSTEIVIHSKHDADSKVTIFVDRRTKYDTGADDGLEIGRILFKDNDEWEFFAKTITAGYISIHGFGGLKDVI